MIGSLQQKEKCFGDLVYVHVIPGMSIRKEEPYCQ